MLSYIVRLELQALMGLWDDEYDWIKRKVLYDTLSVNKLTELIITGLLQVTDMTEANINKTKLDIILSGEFETDDVHEAFDICCEYLV